MGVWPSAVWLRRLSPTNHNPTEPSAFGRRNFRPFIEGFHSTHVPLQQSHLRGASAWVRSCRQFSCPYPLPPKLPKFRVGR